VTLIYKMVGMKTFEKMIKSKQAIPLIFAVGVVIYLLYRSSVRASCSVDSMSTGSTRATPGGGSPVTAYVQKQSTGGTAQPAAPMGENEQYQRVDGIQTSSQGLPSSCSPQSGLQASQLLPKDSNSQFQQLSPQGGGPLQNVSLLQAGYHNGIDTVGSSLRNANLQIRSEPPNPTTKVSPWLNSTIEPDLMRTPLEIGCGSQ
jgi:hypothetical protein